jgi:hypothetical protein
MRLRFRLHTFLAQPHHYLPVQFCRQRPSPVYEAFEAGDLGRYEDRLRLSFEHNLGIIGSMLQLERTVWANSTWSVARWQLEESEKLTC